jgi:hypothetical protein
VDPGAGQAPYARRGQAGGLTLDLPWWAPKPDPGHPAGTGEDTPSGQGGEQVRDIPGNSREPDPYKVITQPLPDGGTRADLYYTGIPEYGDQLISTVDRPTPGAAHAEIADIVTELQHKHGRGAPARITWVPLTGDGQAVEPDRLYGAAGRPGDATLEPLKDTPDGPDADPAAGTSPAATPTTEGDTVPNFTAGSNVPNVELNDLDSLRRFAEYISSLGEDSEFMQIVERCKSLRESLREGGFGGHLDQAGASFEETAAALGQLGTEFCEEAAQMAQLAANVAGG